MGSESDAATDLKTVFIIGNNFENPKKLKAKEDSESPNPTSWLSNEAWAQICSLQQLEAFKVEQECKDVSSIEKICVAGPEGGFCGARGELETDLRCS